ncbi:AlpA family phage regulatory protein [Hydrogenovibrio sp. 3SP14C1]|uniref:helix-turn-helix transcriptional regulator n=1 Tax=Hydrogenovibrio sp. 3SP14C1 TaxID=3038774 RepID=UPI00241668CF|nr:AlpA family phage regulatory protein [Hydrogenovibrio sp. 3SP14C1]MDG4812033.1 AlpA family phage regulatory protein [Hydrogenovibrio sp. 3SP14C1]
MQPRTTIPNQENVSHTLNRFLTLQEVIKILSISRSAIYRRMDSKHELYDPTFPLPIKISGTSSRWIESEIIDWMNQVIERNRRTLIQ